MEKYNREYFDLRKKWMLDMDPTTIEIVTRFPRLLDIKLAVPNL